MAIAYICYQICSAELNMQHFIVFAYPPLSFLYGNTTVASFCNDTTSSVTETTTAETSFAPTSNGIKTTLTPTTG